VIRWAAGRPAVIWSMAVGIVIAGGVAFTKLPLATKTTVELPKISVSGSWRGASPELIETYITSPLESAIQGVRGVRKVSSTSREHQSTITVELDPRADVTLARLAILERVETLRPDLPPAARNGVRVSNWVPEELTEQNLMEINVTGPYTPGALAKIAEDRVVPRLSALPGIAGVNVRGGHAWEWRWPTIRPISASWASIPPRSSPPSARRDWLTPSAPSNSVSTSGMSFCATCHPPSTNSRASPSGRRTAESSRSAN